jgi:hypothetical protein
MIFDLDPTNRLLSSLVGVVVGWCGFLDENLSSCKDLASLEVRQPELASVSDPGVI